MVRGAQIEIDCHSADAHFQVFQTRLQFSSVEEKGGILFIKSVLINRNNNKQYCSQPHSLTQVTIFIALVQTFLHQSIIHKQSKYDLINFWESCPFPCHFLKPFPKQNLISLCLDMNILFPSQVRSTIKIVLLYGLDNFEGLKQMWNITINADHN